MSTSGTYNFSPSLGELVIYSFNQAGVRATALTQEHMTSARMAANLMLGRWAADKGVNLWAVDLQTTPLVQGTTTYTVDPTTVMILDAYIATVDGSGNEIDRIIMPVSRTEYASYPNKQQQGFPTVFWFDRLLAPTVTIWPVPDGTQTSLKYYRVRQIQDAEFKNGLNVEMPNYYLEAFAYGLAYRLAIMWNESKVGMLKPLADEAYAIASTQNVENSNVYITPQLGGYYRP